ncbi:hypothetical protein INT45_009289 [Circinella minor]|uniref:Coenzyme Q-binding protein COQ10 START domain-containing protein n=1 Tax=Circinella minor TaxID=1195481 RepID=A0A8H7S2K8_9FUNG|nr:hypothetical protein INT45_009289 [Circinella minor]
MILSVLITIILVLIPSTPLFIYILGCLLPKNHIISRTKSYKNITAERLWEILTDVESYPLWQPTLERIDYTSKKEKDCLVYTENTKRNKRITTAIILVNNNNNNKEGGKQQQQQQQQILSRIIEEDSIKQQDKPTFIGTWTFKITNTMEDGVILEIEEKGSISRPMIRLLHLILLGFHRRLDRFLKDLGKKIQEEQQLNIKKQEQVINQDHLSKYQQEKEEKESSHGINKNSTTIIESGASLLVQEDWDLMSEIYEKPETASIII